MFQFDQPHLRVTKPISINGIAPKIIDGRVITKVRHLPLAAEKGLNEQNTRLPEGLKMTIEKIAGYKPADIKIVPPPPANIEPVKNKGGRPKKIKENETT